MAISVFKTFVAGEVLTASDLNSSLVQITSGGQSIGSPRTASFDMDGQALIMDADGDTQFQAGSDDVVELTMQGQVLFTWDGDVATAINGIRWTGSAAGVAVGILAQGDDTNIDLSIDGKGTGQVIVDGIRVAREARENRIELGINMVNLRMAQARISELEGQALLYSEISL